MNYKFKKNMSTRAVIQIKKTNGYRVDSKEDRIQYYHHYDSYTSALGIELVQIILELISEMSPDKFKTIFDIKKYLDGTLNQQYEKEEITRNHTDIEYFYLIDFDKGIILTRYKRTDWEKDKSEEPEKWGDKQVLLSASEQEGYYRLELLNYSHKID